MLGSSTLLSCSFTNPFCAGKNFDNLKLHFKLNCFQTFFFFFKRLSYREKREREKNYIMGEEEAIWLLKLLLPYVNELLLKLRSLFSGDPATTLKVNFPVNNFDSCCFNSLR